VSYALWNYLATPFVFTEPGFETREIGPHEENGETWQSKPSTGESKGTGSLRMET
jgi:hypothetical protein